MRIRLIAVLFDLIIVTLWLFTSLVCNSDPNIHLDSDFLTVSVHCLKHDDKYYVDL